MCVCTLILMSYVVPCTAHVVSPPQQTVPVPGCGRGLECGTASPFLPEQSLSVRLLFSRKHGLAHGRAHDLSDWGPQGSAQIYREDQRGSDRRSASGTRKGLDWSEKALYAHDPHPPLMSEHCDVYLVAINPRPVSVSCVLIQLKICLTHSHRPGPFYVVRPSGADAIGMLPPRGDYLEPSRSAPPSDRLPRKACRAAPERASWAYNIIRAAMISTWVRAAACDAA